MATKPIYDLESHLLSVTIEVQVSKKFDGQNGWSLLRKKEWKIFDYLHARTASIPRKKFVTAYKVVDASDPRTISLDEMMEWYGQHPEEEPVSPDLLALVLAHLSSLANARICFITTSPKERCMFCFVPKGIRDGFVPYMNQVEIYQPGACIPECRVGDVYLVTSKPAPLEAP